MESHRGGSFLQSHTQACMRPPENKKVPPTETGQKHGYKVKKTALERVFCAVCSCRSHRVVLKIFQLYSAGNGYVNRRNKQKKRHIGQVGCTNSFLCSKRKSLDGIEHASQTQTTFFRGLILALRRILARIIEGEIDYNEKRFRVSTTQAGYEHSKWYG